MIFCVHPFEGEVSFYEKGMRAQIRVGHLMFSENLLFSVIIITPRPGLKKCLFTKIIPAQEFEDVEIHCFYQPVPGHCFTAFPPIFKFSSINLSKLAFYTVAVQWISLVFCLFLPIIYFI